MRSNCSTGIQASVCKRERLWVRLPLEEMQYLLFYFFRIDVKAKCGVEFRLLTYNDGRTESGELRTCLNIRLLLPTVLYAGYSLKPTEKK